MDPKFFAPKLAQFFLPKILTPKIFLNTTFFQPKYNNRNNTILTSFDSIDITLVMIKYLLLASLP